MRRIWSLLGAPARVQSALAPGGTAIDSGVMSVTFSMFCSDGRSLPCLWDVRTTVRDTHTVASHSVLKPMPKQSKTLRRCSRNISTSRHRVPPGSSSRMYDHQAWHNQYISISPIAIRTPKGGAGPGSGTENVKRFWTAEKGSHEITVPNAKLSHQTISLLTKTL